MLLQHKGKQKIFIPPEQSVIAAMVRITHTNMRKQIRYVFCRLQQSEAYYTSLQTNDAIQLTNIFSRLSTDFNRESVIIPRHGTDSKSGNCVLLRHMILNQASKQYVYVKKMRCELFHGVVVVRTTNTSGTVMVG